MCRDIVSVPTDTTFVRLPNETILDILQILPGRSIINTMCASKSMHMMGARTLYTTVRVVGDSARLFCATMASGSATSCLYASFTRGLSFSSHARHDKYITFPMFCETLLCLTDLRELSIYLSNGDGEFMRSCMHRYGITRRHVSAFDADRLTNAEVLYTPPSLPSLSAFRMGNESSLIDIALFRTLTDLIVTSTMSRKDLESILHAIQHSTCNATLTSLAIRLAADINCQTALKGISDSTPNLRVLTFEQQILNPLVSRSFVLLNVTLIISNRAFFLYLPLGESFYRTSALCC